MPDTHGYTDEYPEFRATKAVSDCLVAVLKLDDAEVRYLAYCLELLVEMNQRRTAKANGLR